MSQRLALSLLTESVIGIFSYINNAVKDRVFNLVELNPFTGEATKLFQRYAQWVITVSDWKDKTDYRGLLKEGDIDQIDLAANYNDCNLYDNVHHALKSPTDFLFGFDFENVADMIYINAAPGDRVMREYLKQISKYKNVKYIAGFGYDHDLHPGVVAAVDSFGGPTLTFPDSSWLIVNKHKSPGRVALKNETR